MNFPAKPSVHYRLDGVWNPDSYINNIDGKFN